ncbi:Carbonic anhydrase 7 [Cryptotermes secundus]|uniref:carbonic anhydrase n=1 Tax=Cryptotermes secundus TaxID=105785 RepID=A0A2J7QNX0_9NEOP|nr:carbonic anhydrase 7 isoform X2 [Cryptotermes secundus]PNF30278.1 Carbonic anhydrase 7 [Cryptotermes secundus]
MKLVVAANLLLALLLSGGCLPAWTSDTKGHMFGYDDHNGPSHWAEEYETCAGKFQSPIDIEEHLVTQVRLPPLHFHGFQSEPISSTVTNNGHTVMLQMNMSKMASVSGGPLKGNYLFTQLHFHWGYNDSVGSEDTINNHTFPLELHIVMYKENYGTFENATHYKDGLTVLAVFYEIYETENQVYSEIVQLLPFVTMPNSQHQLKKLITLDSLLPMTKHLYFTYNGSLTTPPCLEVVTWIEFKQPILLSHYQVEAFRKLKSREGLMTHNFRPVQPLSGRPVWFNVADDMSHEKRGHDSAANPLETSYVLVSFFVLLLSVLER